MIYKKLWLHNINDVEEREGKHILHRFPREVRQNLESSGEVSALHSSSEIRFTIRGKVWIRLSSINKTEKNSLVIVYYGDNQHQSYTIPPEGVLITLESPYGAGTGEKIMGIYRRFRPDTVRILLFQTISLDGIGGDYETPGAGSFPAKKYLAYGTSITQGGNALLPDLSYPEILGNFIGYDVYNYGMSGACFIEDPIIKFLSSEPYDFISLCLSINMMEHGYSPGVFKDRVEKLTAALRGKNPESPLFLISILTNCHDLAIPGKYEVAEETCGAYRKIIADLADREGGIFFLDGRNLVSSSNLTTDFCHPGDYGMIEIAYKIFEAFKRVSP